MCYRTIRLLSMKKQRSARMYSLTGLPDFSRYFTLRNEEDRELPVSLCHFIIGHFIIGCTQRIPIFSYTTFSSVLRRERDPHLYK